MKRSTDRKNKLEQKFKDANITNYTFIEAVDGQNNDLSSYNFKVISEWIEPFSSRIMTKGEIGCSLSHYNIWKKMIDQNLDNILILEDDVEFTDEVNNISEYFKFLPEDWDMVYFGGNHNTHMRVHPPKIINEKDKVGKAAYSPVVKDLMGSRPTTEQVETIIDTKANETRRKHIDFAALANMNFRTPKKK
jgi:GR25 family glycosyltransferase involved in LPS biosynthesis